MPSPDLADSTTESEREVDGGEEKDNARDGGRRAWKGTALKEIRGKVRRLDEDGGISVTSAQLL